LTTGQGWNFMGSENYGMALSLIGASRAIQLFICLPRSVKPYFCSYF